MFIWVPQHITYYMENSNPDMRIIPGVRKASVSVSPAPCTRFKVLPALISAQYAGHNIDFWWNFKTKHVYNTHTCVCVCGQVRSFQRLFFFRRRKVPEGIHIGPSAEFQTARDLGGNVSSLFVISCLPSQHSSTNSHPPAAINSLFAFKSTPSEWYIILRRPIEIETLLKEKNNKYLYTVYTVISIHRTGSVLDIYLYSIHKECTCLRCEIFLN